MPHYSFLILLLCISLPAVSADLPQKVHHQLHVTLDPDPGSLTATDSIQLPAPVSSISLRLHAALKLRLTDTNARIINSSLVSAAVPVKQYTIQFTQPSQSLSLEYMGKLSHQLSQRVDNYASGRQSSPGLISREGVFLSGSSYWYPQLAEPLLSFSLTVKLPKGWTSVSQGKQTGTNHWIETQPQDDIYLIAAPFHIYQKETLVAKTQVFLRQSDDELAQRYLDATDTYLNLFQSLLGDYPYSKFALVENFWETGYGMPSFTLLGPRVIRLPFILYSSYPHEILHNWWGNSVYVDYASGNWAEGLTAYLADHLLQEQKGKGADYRRSSLQKYADYVVDASDFPLTEFIAHQGEVSQAVGYGKALMMFHMLRKKLGDTAFINGLRRFYQDNRFQFAGYENLRRAFEQESNQPLAAFFSQWTTRTGAPALTLDRIAATQTDNGWLLEGLLRQTQTEAFYRLNVPLFIQLQGHEQATSINLKMQQKSVEISLQLPAKPLRISIDSRFELFRTLLPEELPASLGQLFGAHEISVVLPSRASNEMKQAWTDLANGWQQKSADIKVLWDDQISRLPEDQSLWILGQENLLIPHLEPILGQHGLQIKDNRANWLGSSYSLSNHSLALSVTHPEKKPAAVGFISASSAASVPILARKLPHYGRYSMTLFSGDSVHNLLKLQWPLVDSPLQVNLTGHKIPPMLIPPLSPLITTVEALKH